MLFVSCSALTRAVKIKEKIISNYFGNFPEMSQIYHGMVTSDYQENLFSAFKCKNGFINSYDLNNNHISFFQFMFCIVEDAFTNNKVTQILGDKSMHEKVIKN
jgi:hypothetical protein